MKLTDILKEVGEEGGEQKVVRASYDIGIQPDSIEDTLKALQNISNYGMYAQNMRKPDVIKRIFGPSIPAQKAGAAWKDWNSRSTEEKIAKISDVKNRVPEAYAEAVEKNTSKYEAWKEEGNEGNFEDWLVSLTGRSLPIEFYGRYGKNYFPMKTPDNLKKYSGVMEPETHYYVENDIVVFPQKSSPFNSKPYLKKVLKTIMDNAGLSFSFVDVEVEDDGEETTTVAAKPKAPTVPPLSTTVDTADQADKLRKLFQSRLGEVLTVRYEVEPVGTGAERKYKLIVTGISADQRTKLQPLALTLKKT